MGRSNKFSKKTKIEACENYESGKGTLRGIAREFGCSPHSLRQWYYNYLEQGEHAFDTKNSRRAYSKEFKLEVIELHFR